MKIFISYSHKDEEWKNKLEKHLRVFELEGILETWSDRKVETGEDWILKIKEALNFSNIAILLISKDFLISDFIKKKEVPTILKRRKTEDLIIFPIIIRPCNWEEVEWLKKIKVQPKDGKPLSSFGNEKDKIESQLAELASKINNIFPISLKQLSKIKSLFENLNISQDKLKRIFDRVLPSPNNFSFPLCHEKENLIFCIIDKLSMMLQTSENKVPVLDFVIYIMNHHIDDSNTKTKVKTWLHETEKKFELKIQDVNNSIKEKSEEFNYDYNNINDEPKHFDTIKSSFLDFLYAYKNILFIISSIIMLLLVFSYNNKEISIYFYKFLNSNNYKYKLGETYKESITGIEFVWITGGFFEMGCNNSEILCEEYEKPIHEVFIDGFWIGKYEITQEQWQRVMKDNPSANQNGKDNPVERVSWKDTQKFIKKLIELNKNNIKFRLPTEAEWEYACRKSVNEELNKNTFGLYNMIHSVDEWCKDVYYSGAYSQHKRINPCYLDENKGSGRVVRGRLLNNLKHFKCTFRQSFPENSKGKLIGFRVVFNP